MSKLVASIHTPSFADMLRASTDAVAGADLVELRIDGLRDREVDLETLRGARTLPLVLTCRSKSEGGSFEGTEDERRKLLSRALSLGFDYVDVEIDSATEELLSARRPETRVILSHHDFDGIPRDLDALVSRGVALGADVIKIAAHVVSLDDVFRLAEIGASVREQGRAYAPVPMGPSGLSGRILGARFRSELVYATARGLAATGPGQLTIDDMLELYRFRSIGEATQVYGILGSAVLRSLSPVMHNRFFEGRGMDAVYVPFDEADLTRFVGAARKLPVSGLSVTRPHKEAILPFLDTIDEGAKRMGAVNTIRVSDGRWEGFNTDGDGVLEPLRRRTELRGKRAVVLGAGGAARAAAFALHDAGARVTVLSRRRERAEEVAAAVSGSAGTLDEIHRFPYDVLVNATPVGDRSSLQQLPISADALRERSFVLDTIYDPEETALGKAARRAGAEVIPGLEMLVAQAAKQAEIWTGVKPDPALLEAAARADERVSHKRYSRQVLFEGIGVAGQKRLLRARVLVVGLGALGSVTTEMLARAGVGFLRLVDRDYVDETNLQRQSLYDEEDVERNLPKAVAASAKLGRINHHVRLEVRVVDFGYDNAEGLASDVDLVLDGTDNFETRFVVNDACVKLGKPWVYAAAVSSYGMSFVVRPGVTPCLRCLLEEEPPPGLSPSCDTVGVLAPAVHAVAAFQTAEALKILVGREADLTPGIVSLDLWTGRIERMSNARRRPDCPCCGQRTFDFLEGKGAARTTKLCGRDAVQVRPGARTGTLALQDLAARLRPLGEVAVNPFLLRFTVGGRTLVVFPDGRAIVHGTEDAAEAKSLYARYVSTWGL